MLLCMYFEFVHRHQDEFEKQIIARHVLWMMLQLEHAYPDPLQRRKSVRGSAPMTRADVISDVVGTISATSGGQGEAKVKMKERHRSNSLKVAARRCWLWCIPSSWPFFSLIV